MSLRLRLCMVVVLVLFTAGCARSRYAWDDYEDRLYSYYKNPAESDQFMEGLQEIIQDGEAENRVPPGIYAEYGYMLYERGKFPDAVLWYTKERDRWPESRLLMDKMIALANGRKSRPDAKGAAGGQYPAPEPAREQQP